MRFFIVLLVSIFIHSTQAADYFYKGKYVGRSKIQNNKQYFYDSKGKILGSTDLNRYHNRVMDSRGKVIGHVKGNDHIRTFYKLYK